MAMHKGQLFRVDKHEGGITRKKIFHVIVTPVTFVKGALAKIPNETVEFQDKGTFTGNLKRLSVLYRFLAGVGRIFKRHEATVDTAPATTMDADTAFHTSKESPLSSDPAEALTAKSKIGSSRLVKLVAYARAPAVTICNILMGHLAGLFPADGAIARYLKVIQIGHESTADTADSAVAASRDNTILSDGKGTGCSAPTQDIPAVESTFTSDNTATVKTADVADVEAYGTQKTWASAEAFTWVLPECADGVLSIFQIFSGIQSGDTVEVDMETESSYWETNIIQDGVLSLVFAQTEAQTDNELKVI